MNVPVFVDDKINNMLFHLGIFVVFAKLHKTIYNANYICELFSTPSFKSIITNNVIIHNIFSKSVELWLSENSNKRDAGDCTRSV